MQNLISQTAKKVSNYYTTKELKNLHHSITAVYPEQIFELRLQLEKVFVSYSAEQLQSINNSIDKKLK